MRLGSWGQSIFRKMEICGNLTPGCLRKSQTTTLFLSKGRRGGSIPVAPEDTTTDTTKSAQLSPQYDGAGKANDRFPRTNGEPRHLHSFSTSNHAEIKTLKMFPNFPYTCMHQQVGT